MALGCAGSIHTPLNVVRNSLSELKPKAMNDPIPNEAPPAYTPTDHLQVPSAAAASSAGAESADRRHRRTSSAGSTASSNYTTDDDHYEESENGIPEEVRRDMLDESRPLPDGWRRLVLQRA